jgi:single-strand DNA-binding protein
MAGFNRVILLGNLTRDPQLRYLANNMAVCDIGIAVSRRYRDREGNQKEDTCFVDATAWGRQAETINQYMAKGRPILIEGRLKLDQWTGQDGQRRSKLSVVVENFQFVGAREGGPAGGATGGPPPAAPPERAAAAPPGRAAAPHPEPPVDAPGPDYGEEPPRTEEIPF